MSYLPKDLTTTKITNATDIAAAKTGFIVKLYGLALAGATTGKLQSGGTTDISDVLPTGYMMADSPAYLAKSKVSEKLNITGAAQTGMAIWAYEVAPSQAN